MRGHQRGDEHGEQHGGENAGANQVPDAEPKAGAAGARFGLWQNGRGRGELGGVHGAASCGVRRSRSDHSAEDNAVTSVSEPTATWAVVRNPWSRPPDFTV